MSTETLAPIEDDVDRPPPVQIAIVSDFICPWCLIGHERLQKTLAEFDGKVDVEITWLPFELNPNMPPEGKDRREYRTAKFGSWDYSQELDAGTVAAGSPDGVTFNYDLIERTPNTFAAHRLSWYASQTGRQTEMVTALLEAYFQKGRDIGDYETLASVANDLGFDRNDILRFLNSEEGVKEVGDLARRTRSVVRGVPHIEIADAVIQGAQPPAVFRAAIETAVQSAGSQT
ncbi:MAG: DsbA family oxidoreductase [Pseudomonadota bacterium]